MKCARCKGQIGSKEKYVRITDFDNGDKIKEIYLHILCWKDLFKNKIQEALKEKVNQVMKIIQ